MFESAWESASDIVADERGNGAAIFFDLNGTLCDSFQLGYQATKDVLGDGNLLSEDDYRKNSKFCTPERLARHVGLRPGTEQFRNVGMELGEKFNSLYISRVNKDTAP